jgi:UDP-N-acetylmuramate dehydrogenase
LLQSLKNYNSFGVDSNTQSLVEITSEEQLQQLVAQKLELEQLLVIGAGSNLLLQPEAPKLVLASRLSGINYQEQDHQVLVTAASGEPWHELVMDTVAKGYHGLENLALIPGLVGAAPIQNIGAYGVELKDRFVELKALNLVNGERKIFKKTDCQFEYRKSIFKAANNPWFILSVTLALSKDFTPVLSYGELQKAFPKPPTAKQLVDKVIAVRSAKLPDPQKLGNAGSFFKNPIVSAEQHARLQQAFPKLVSYPTGEGQYKLAAGWLIDQLGLKGYRLGDAAVHQHQALVIVNHGNATGEQIKVLAQSIKDKVMATYEVELEHEVSIIGSQGHQYLD